MSDEQGVVETGQTEEAAVIESEAAETAEDTTQVTEESTAAAESWLPEDLRGNERLKGFESPEALARAFADAKFEQELPDTYQLPQGAPEQLSKWAKENKFSQSHLDAMLGLQKQIFENSEKAKNTVYDQGRNELFKAWGDKKDDNIRMGNSVFESIPSGQKLAQFIKATGEGKNPVVIQALQEIGSLLQEGGFLSTNTPRIEPKKDPLKARYPTMFPKEEE